MAETCPRYRRKHHSERLALKRPHAIIFILVMILGVVTYRTLDYYVLTIKVHVPVFGNIDTGVTKYEMDQFEAAHADYKKKEEPVRRRFAGGEITEQEFLEEMTTINNQRLSDPRVTAVTGGPAKQLLSFLVDKM
ncbi:MAG: hypothetical protein DRQ65_09070 [Gammaproteobacteria bacterium]|nr:MAG: hypothetical protein DRQ65_09070 [Gammaproteobacteria bacterium]